MGGRGVERSRAKGALGTAGMELEVVTGPFDLTAEAENAAALAVREAVTNVLRHSKAGSCRIEYLQSKGVFRLIVSDDGRGGRFSEGNGLAGMRERIETLGGRIEVDGSDGTRIEIELPLDGATQDDRPASGETAVG